MGTRRTTHDGCWIKQFLNPQIAIANQLSDIRVGELVTADVVENEIEDDVTGLLSSLGINPKKIPHRATRTPDYGEDDVAIEVTAVHPYFPQTIKDYDVALADLCRDLGNCSYAYLYMEQEKPNFKIVRKEKCDSNMSVLFVKQHVSIYTKKIIAKIDEKYYQTGDHAKEILVLDFRTAHFDPETLANEIKAVLAKAGDLYPSLLGIIAAVPKRIDLIRDVSYFIVLNPHASAPSSLVLQKLKPIEKIPQSTARISPTPIHVFMVHPVGEGITDGMMDNIPSIPELSALGLPV